LRKYETIFIIDSLLKSEEIDSIVTKFERFISANGGKIETLERWGKKRLTFEIKKRQYGYYVFIRFDGPPAMIKSLEREYRLNESLLRFKTILLDKLALKALEHQPYIKPATEFIDEGSDLTPSGQPTDIEKNRENTQRDLSDDRQSEKKGTEVK
jgi:small subunit ribosomal protein S6